jgi:hypothetical protein
MRSTMKWQFAAITQLVAAMLVAVPSGSLLAGNHVAPANQPAFEPVPATVLALGSSVELLELAAVTLASDLEAVPASLGPSPRPCPDERLRVSWEAPGGSALGAYLEPIGPRPDTSTTDVNGVVVCAGSQAGFMGFEAHRESTSWRLYPVPVPDAAHRLAPADPTRAHHGEASDTQTLIAGAATAAGATEPDLDGLPLGSPAVMDVYASYEPQRTCDPSPKRGAAMLAGLLLHAVPGTTNLGISRACHVGSTSEHKEGRAFDWGVWPGHAAAVDEVLARLLATDQDGNAHALARRMGIMYVIWDGAIWASNRPDAGWRPYRGPDPHTEHVHISLSWRGGLGLTSFWRTTDPATALEAATSRAGAPTRDRWAETSSPRASGTANAEVPSQPTGRDAALTTAARTRVTSPEADRLTRPMPPLPSATADPPAARPSDDPVVPQQRSTTEPSPGTKPIPETKPTDTRREKSDSTPEPPTGPVPLDPGPRDDPMPDPNPDRGTDPDPVADAPHPSPGGAISVDPVGPAPVVPEVLPPPAGALGSVDPATYFTVADDEVDLRFAAATSGDLWVWQEPSPPGTPGRLARYTNGAWWSYPAPPAGLPADRETFDRGPDVDVGGLPVWTWDVAELPDGTIVAATGQGLQEFTGTGWQPHPDWRNIPGCDGLNCNEQSRRPTAVEVDPSSGTVWVAAGSGLYRWEDREITDVSPGPEVWTDDDHWIGALEVTPDGTVWGTGHAAPYWLQTYLPSSNSWGYVDPWPGGKDTNVAVMAATPDGDLWAVTHLEAHGRYGKPWRLARRDADSGDWTTYDAWLPPVDADQWHLPRAMVADDRGVWVTFERFDPQRGTFEAGYGVHHFDGFHWETWHQAHRVGALGRAGDGTTWAALLDQGLTALATSRPTLD